jgi:hypothetical protein
MKIVAAPTVWLAHFVAVYVLLSLACASDGASQTLFGFGTVALGVALATVVAFALIAGIAWASRAGARPRDASGLWAARVSLYLCGLSTLAVAWVAYPAFVLPPCAA